MATSKFIIEVGDEDFEGGRMSFRYSRDCSSNDNNCVADERVGGVVIEPKKHYHIYKEQFSDNFISIFKRKKLPKFNERQLKIHNFQHFQKQT